MRKIVSSILVVILIALIGCSNESTKTQYIEDDSTESYLLISFDEMYGNYVYPDSLRLDLSFNGLDQCYVFTNLNEYALVIDSLEVNSVVDMKATLYFDDMRKTTYSQFTKSTGSIIGSLTSRYYHDNVILKLDTNQAVHVHPSDFYDFTVFDKFFKQYHIENAEALADAYLATPMKFMTDNHTYSNVDENNIPLTEYTPGVWSYNPVFTCNNAFGHHDDYLETGNEESLAKFYDNVDWLLENKDDDAFLRYEFEFQHGPVPLELGWTSAMAQGQALAAVCMAYHTSGDEKYLQAAHEFYATMHTNVGETWNVYIDEEDYLWFEEYPNPDFCHVLNGKLFGMWGLWDYYCITKNEDALVLLQGGIASILDNYPIWNIDGVDGSRYCKHTTTISTYHRIHKLQLAAYRDMFNIDEFDVVLNTFTNQRN